ncbi:MAG: hypothetical protein R3326_06925 [Gemmatimonadota bacterium]|nr:hypothetical protein [Gemmatimonadota bacterium]
MSIALAFGMLAIAGAIAACGTGSADGVNSPADAEPDFPRGSAAGALPGDTLVSPAPKWRPDGYEIEPIPPDERRLEGAARSLDGLLRTIETALAERDTQRLARSMLSEREYREIFYPALPAAHPPMNASFETLWVSHFPDSWRGLELALGRYGGRDVEILAVRFAAPNQDLVNFALHHVSRVDLIVDGEMRPDARLFGSVIVVDGRWKVVSYPDEP